MRSLEKAKWCAGPENRRKRSKRKAAALWVLASLEDNLRPHNGGWTVRTIKPKPFKADWNWFATKPAALRALRNEYGP